MSESASSAEPVESLTLRKAAASTLLEALALIEAEDYLLALGLLNSARRQVRIALEADSEWTDLIRPGENS
jgi:hypothetical protein